ncbi:sporulation-specific diadenylate cyclase CdaS [Brevibacillus sp. FSL K6-0770]|uniref:sporulation-specific diadenylate cyclase CdaS n=1 Tax=Brevibacillus sp. 1238 TaxID=2940565 RepID=UPI00142DE148|nr:MULTISPECIES: sporulation-specific diadenylate cyclase CdaS [Brevibacillus]NRQ52450.1 DNA integrity scanning protein DisA nucleotide-binding domain protein [Brevibacillus sp. HD1.4A]MBU8712353.1 sporulation-specific diadenylate cyclase CdaS [Brevibacillus parabrevis]MDR5002546.1 sporulation-specific diadenylate cyclase CdaS [Brevibacillus parabrevis]MED2257306.1 sporulation-specific diadenylate cyclase CdaS [Brevibacillus parabrevis]UED71957.1 sporulation-specific diadenylate cyclase CdaS [
MVQMNCDTSSLKAELKQELTSILAVMQQSLLALDQAEGCLLGTFDEIRSRFSRLETTAASFYLQCYLAPYSSTYTDLSLAVSHLAQKRQGALVVMEREDSVAPFLQAGIPIGAVLSHSLLESIFFPGSPLHDGAVYIRGDQIVSAANVLPLSQITVGEKKLGTRHRAALGLSEQCDALIIVVSEETGKASFALQGRLYPIITHM